MFYQTTIWPILNFFIFFPVAIAIHGFGHFGLSRIAYGCLLHIPFDRDHYMSLSWRGFWVGLTSQIIVSILIHIAFQSFYFPRYTCEFPPTTEAGVQTSIIIFTVILCVYTLMSFLALYTLALPRLIPDNKKRLIYTLFVTIPLGSSFYLFTFLPYALYMMLP